MLGSLATRPPLGTHGVRFYRVRNPSGHNVSYTLLCGPTLFAIGGIGLIPCIRRLTGSSTFCAHNFLAIENRVTKSSITIVIYR